MKLWYVLGNSGEYEDQREWVVGIRFTQAAADELAKVCADYAQLSGYLDRWVDPSYGYLPHGSVPHEVLIAREKAEDDRRRLLVATGPDPQAQPRLSTGVGYDVCESGVTGTHDEAMAFFDGLMAELHAGKK